MNTIRSYTWPVLMALVSGVTAFADVIKDSFLAELLAYALIGLGVAAIVFFRAPGISRVSRKWFPGAGTDFSPGAFAVSCGVLGVAVFGFAQLSARLSDQGGVIAAAFPEVTEIQQQLGVVQEDVARIEETTANTAVVVDAISEDTVFLTKAAGQWLGIESLFYSPEFGTMNLRINNPSSFVFDELDIVVRDSANPSKIILHRAGILARAELREFRAEGLGELDAIEVCISGRRKQDGLWGMETRIYGHSDMDDMFGSFSVIDTEGLQPTTPDRRCM